MMFYLRGDGGRGGEELELTLLQLLVERGLGVDDGLHDLVGLHLVLLVPFILLLLLAALLLVGMAASCSATLDGTYGGRVSDPRFRDSLPRNFKLT